MNQKVNSVIEVNDGTYLVTETLQQIQEQSQKGDLLHLHVKRKGSSEFFHILLHVNEIKMVADAEENQKLKKSKNNQSEQVGSEFLKGFADYLYNKYGKDD